MITKIEIERASNGFIIETESSAEDNKGLMTMAMPAKREVSFVATNEKQVVAHVRALLGKMTASNSEDDK